MFDYLTRLIKKGSLMLEAESLVIALVAECGDSPQFGRTTLQKMAYLSTVALRWSPVGHQAHFYGPFSRQLERTTARLVTNDLIDEQSEDLGFASPGGYQAKRFHYLLTERGKRAFDELEQSQPSDVAQVRTFVQAVRAAVGGFDQAVLSLASKVHYIVVRRGGAVGREEISKEARDLGWRISSSQIDKVVRVLEQLQILRSSPSQLSGSPSVSR